MENTVTKPGFRKKFLGDKAFYKMVLAIAIPIMIQNGITNFVSLLESKPPKRMQAKASIKTIGDLPEAS